MLVFFLINKTFEIPEDLTLSQVSHSILLVSSSIQNKVINRRSAMMIFTVSEHY